MRLTPCNCGLGYLVRLNRSLWMRLVPGRRHYYCVRCKSHELLSREGLRALFPELPSLMDRDQTAPAPLEELEVPPLPTAYRRADRRRTHWPVPPSSRR
jgi:hypothetical protein